MDVALRENRWITKNESDSLNGMEKKTLLIQKLKVGLNDGVHTFMDLFETDVTSANGGLCGLAALYQAMVDTFMTTSQLKYMSYFDIKMVILEELDLTGQRMSDKDLLIKFYDCKA